MSSKGTMDAINKAPDNLTSSENKTRSGSGQKFANLEEMKRGSGNTTAEANRQSFTEQTKATGSIGAIWDKVTKGTSTD